jgi:hypothetical protein
LILAIVVAGLLWFFFGLAALPVAAIFYLVRKEKWVLSIAVTIAYLFVLGSGILQ